MRPVERGPDPGPFQDYAEARDPLIHRIGDYCTYCENALHSEIHVEHMQPKSRPPHAELVWTNFLLACGYCNSVKGDHPVVIAEHFWPDADNTFRAFKYDPNMPPAVSGGLTPSQQIIAQRTLELTGLDRRPGHPQLTNRDRRWKKRLEAWGVALLSFKNLQEQDTPQHRDAIVFTAISRGFWSVWITVFQHDSDMRQRFIRGFRGTARNCFDADGNPVPRPGGQL